MMFSSHRKRQIIHDRKLTSILIVPAAEKGHGGGHLCRCISLTNDLRALGRNVFLFMPPQDRDLSGLFNSMNFNPKWCITNAELEIRNTKLSETFEYVILDRFRTPPEELLYWKKIAPVIGIDEGGSCRDKFDFLIDILIPEKLGKPSANIASPALLNFPKDLTQRRKGTEDAEDKKEIKVLITFGQEDAAGLGLKTAKMLSTMKCKLAMDITLLWGALTNNIEQMPENIRILQVIPNLAEQLHEYDLVITHYGITAYEALYSGTQVLLAHPTPYHKKLAKAAGFLDIKHLNKIIKKIRGLTQINADEVPRKSADIHNNFLDTSLAELINSFSPVVNRNCPVCGAEEGRCISRFSDRTYRQCTKCGIIYMSRLNPAPIEYGKEYFFESYKKQYGKTYLEDFENIKNAAKRRLNIIANISHRGAKAQSTQSLLDIGCAYGPFLAAAKEVGFIPTGIDPAEDAVNYVNKELGITAIHGLFPIPYTLHPNSYDVITMWLVIEHFQDCITALEEIKKILKGGGILAFSTPSFSGISGRSSLRNFLSISPADHWTVWSPKMSKKALAFAGFMVKKITITGHHPQRFPFLGRFAKSKKSAVYWILMAISKIFGLGDTFEVYAKLR